MNKFKILAATFTEAEWGYFEPGSKDLRIADAVFSSSRIPANKIQSLEIASSENVKTFADTFGRAILGSLAFGIIGAAAALGSCSKMQIAFICVFKDGDRMLAKADSKTYELLLAETFK